MLRSHNWKGFKKRDIFVANPSNPHFVDAILRKMIVSISCCLIAFPRLRRCFVLTRILSLPRQLFFPVNSRWVEFRNYCVNFRTKDGAIKPKHALEQLPENICRETKVWRILTRNTVRNYYECPIVIIRQSEDDACRRRFHHPLCLRDPQLLAGVSQSNASVYQSGGRAGEGLRKRHAGCHH